MAQFEVPLEFEGKSLKQIRDEGNLAFRPDLLGFDENIPLTAGQTLSFRDDPGSSEFQFLQSKFAPVGTAAATAFQTEQRVRSDEFIGRIQDIPETLEAARQASGVPGAQALFSEAGQGARDIAGRIRDIPGVQAQAARGFDVTQNQLERIIAQKLIDIQPSAETASRTLESATAGLSEALGDFTARTQGVFSVFELESGVLGESAAQAFGLFKTQISNDLDRELEQMRQTGATDRANIDRAIKLAQLEAASEQGEFRSLGDRVELINPATGEIIETFQIGLAPLRPVTPPGPGGKPLLRNIDDIEF